MSELARNNRSFIISLVFNVVLLVGLAVLYFLFFTQGKETHNDNTENLLPFVSSNGNAFVFVNSDILLSEYEMVSVLTEELQKERQKKDADFIAQQKAYEADAAYFQQQVESQAISQESAQQIYEQLMLKQQELYEIQEQYTAQLAQQEFNMNVILLDSIRNFLTRMNEKNKYDYILSYNTAGNILFAKDTFDITSHVLQGLNEEYQLIQETE